MISFLINMAFLLMNMLAMDSQKEISEDQIEKFEAKLRELLTNADERNRNLHVDYHPDPMLSEAAEFAGIPTSVFPCKTSTWIQDGKALASYQYGSPIVEL